MRVWIPTT